MAFERMKAEAKERFSSVWGATSVIFIVAIVVFAFQMLRTPDLIDKSFFMVYAMICLSFAVIYENTHNIHKLRVEVEILNEEKKK
jgi:Kef-type K+ transport system membrane component KefB